MHRTTRSVSVVTLWMNPNLKYSYWNPNQPSRSRLKPFACCLLSLCSLGLCSICHYGSQAHAALKPPG